MGTMQDYDPGETQEWVDSLKAVIAHVGPERARYLLGKLRNEALRAGVMPSFLATTPYRNTIPPEQEEKSSGNREIEHKIRSAIRWNAVAIILRANKESSELGGHIASFQSSALLYDIGFGHFWRGASGDHGGDLIYVQGHVAPGIYGRAYVEGRLTDEQLKNFRQESDGKIIQELEGIFRGAGWNVIKVVWGSAWDALFAKDEAGILLKRMEECVDGQYQDFKSKDGAYVREHFFNTPELKALVANLSDEQVWKLNRGGHDPFKVYAAYAAAVKHKGQPTVILAKTVKGYGMGESGEGQMISHQAKKMTQDALKQFRERFQIPITAKQFEAIEFVRFADDSAEMKYLKDRRAALGGYLPVRRQKSQALAAPAVSSCARRLQRPGGRETPTTMAFVRMRGPLVGDKTIGKHIVPIVPDEPRTFGMEGMSPRLGIYWGVAQLYKPQDADQLMY